VLSHTHSQCPECKCKLGKARETTEEGAAAAHQATHNICPGRHMLSSYMYDDPQFSQAALQRPKQDSKDS
jgi:hypothetical protein